MSLIQEFIDRSLKEQVRIAVVGDAMIDEYYDVEATRISPEFPIPVMRSLNDKPTACLPGGSANVAYQFKHWNAASALFAWVDRQLSSCLGKVLDLDNYYDCIHIDRHGGSIPRKRRIYDGTHPTFRWDIEEPNCGFDDEKLAAYQKKLFHQFLLRTEHTPPKAVILSDYHKGLFATHTTANGLKARQQWAALDCITIVDPKSAPVEGWAGCTIFKPNAKEARELSGKSDWREQAVFLGEKLNCKHVVITQGHHGVAGWSAPASGRSEPEFFKVPNRWNVDAKSVIGAGDCFVAFLTLAYTLGFNIALAAEIAYQAGACYVQGSRNKPITPHDLLAMEDPIAAKFLPPPNKDSRDFKLGFTNGCFDLLHTGHLESLRFAKSQCDKLVVAVNDDDSVKALKGSRRPYVKLESRMNLLAALDCVDYVVPFSDPTPLKLIKTYQPEVLVKGSEYHDKIIVGKEHVEHVVLCPMIEGMSTSSLEQIIWSAANRSQEVSTS